MVVMRNSVMALEELGGDEWGEAAWRRAECEPSGKEIKRCDEGIASQRKLNQLTGSGEGLQEPWG